VFPTEGCLLPWPPPVVATIDLECSEGIEPWVEELSGMCHPNFRQPGFVPLVIDLEEAIATVVGNSDDIWIEFAFTPGNEECSFFEIVGPHFSNDCDDLCL
jgi:hypothetical protein